MQLEQASARFDTIVGEIRSLLSQIEGEVSSCRSSFAGQAATQYSAVMAQYHTDATQLNQALSSISEAIKASATGFHATDADSSAALRNAGSGLNFN